MSLGGGHVQRGSVHFGAGVSADAGSQQDVGRRVMTVLSGQVERRRAQLQDAQTDTTSLSLTLNTSTAASAPSG